MGPHTFNFADAAEMALQSQAALRAENLDHAIALALSWVAHPQDLRMRSESAQVFANAHCGAVDRSVQALARFIDQRSA
jgi:3-deoxy-D-manno-octulosonic-acid transferase